jgi:hypothetical protein
MSAANTLAKPVFNYYTFSYNLAFRFLFFIPGRGIAGGVGFFHFRVTSRHRIHSPGTPGLLSGPNEKGVTAEINLFIFL